MSRRRVRTVLTSGDYARVPAEIQAPAQDPAAQRPNRHHVFTALQHQGVVVQHAPGDHQADGSPANPAQH
jgi:hypothetical protein